VLDFSSCGFLRQNAVACLGAFAHWVRSSGGECVIDLPTIRPDVSKNLGRNGFLGAFGYHTQPWIGNTIPYRHDQAVDRDGLMEYLRSSWLGRGWINVSAGLRDAIVGRVWEIYENAFEHSQSASGVFSCGQFYPNRRLLKLTVLDLGRGIPSNVRGFPGNERMDAAEAVRWAFLPGTSTKWNGLGRGLGLDLLKRFVQVNAGRLDIYSDDAYAVVDAAEERYAKRSPSCRGTLVNITLKCDEAYYHLDTEAPETFPF
jgi:hypothetical protein